MLPGRGVDEGTQNTFSHATRDLFCYVNSLLFSPPKLSFPSLGARMGLKHNLLFSAKLNWEALREHLNHLWYFSLEKQDRFWACYLAVRSTSKRSRVRLLQRICCAVPWLSVHPPGFSYLCHSSLLSLLHKWHRIRKYQRLSVPWQRENSPRSYGSCTWFWASCVHAVPFYFTTHLRYCFSFCSSIPYFCK